MERSEIGGPALRFAPCGLRILAQLPPDAPAAEHRFHLVGDKMACAVAIIALRQQVIVIREHMTRIRDEREPCGILRRRSAQPLAIQRMIDDRAKLMRRDFGSELTERCFDCGATRERIHLRAGPPASALRTRANSPAVWLTRAAIASRMRRAASG